MAANGNTLSLEEVSDLLKDVLKSENISDAKFEISSGSRKGDGYMSYMTRVKIYNNDKIYNVIIKRAPMSDKMRVVVPIHTCYQFEIHFYDNIFTQMKKFQIERNVDPFNFMPKCLKTIKEKYTETLIMENIISEGFQMWVKKLKMNHAHTSMGLKLFAKFHAVSLAMQDQAADVYSDLVSKVHNVVWEFAPNILINPFIEVSEMVADLFADDNENVRAAMNRFIKEIKPFYLEGSDIRPKYNVICHGDCWCNNIMFKYEEGSSEPKDMRLIDFQLMRIASPAMDISFFIYANSEKEIYHNLDKYLKIYHNEMGNHMKAMGSDIEKLYPFTEFMNDWRKYSRFGYVWALLVRRLSLLEDDEVADIHDIAECGKEALVTGPIKNSAILNEMIKDLTLHMYNNGFLV